VLSAFVLISADPARIDALGHDLAEITAVREAHSVAGSDVDLVAVLAIADHETLADVVTGEIAKLDGIRETRTLIAFRQYSSAEEAAAFEGLGD
jgi:DNA-binding Lrp family transcriptional regulator